MIKKAGTEQISFIFTCAVIFNFTNRRPFLRTEISEAEYNLLFLE